MKGQVGGGAAKLQDLICISAHLSAKAKSSSYSCGFSLILRGKNQIGKFLRRVILIYFEFFEKIVYYKCQRKSFLRTLDASQKCNVITITDKDDGRVPGSGWCCSDLRSDLCPFEQEKGFRSHGSFVSNMFPGGDHNPPVAVMGSVGPLRVYSFFLVTHSSCPKMDSPLGNEGDVFLVTGVLSSRIS